MFENLTRWQVVYYTASYLLGTLFAYLGLVAYRIWKNKKRYYILGTFLYILGISAIIVVGSSPHMPSPIQPIVLGGLWGTCGLLGILFYYIRMKLVKNKNNDYGGV